MKFFPLNYFYETCFIFLQDFKLVNVDLTPKEIIDILAVDDPNVTDPEGAINLELEVSMIVSNK